MKRNIFLMIVFCVLIASWGYAQDTQKLLLDQVSQAYSHKDLPSGAGNSGLIGGFSTAGLIGSILFSSIGFVAFVYGKRREEFKIMVIGFLLMGFPYLVRTTWMLYVVGICLTAAIYFF